MSARVSAVLGLLLLGANGCYCSGGPVADCRSVDVACELNDDCCSFGCVRGVCRCNPEVGGTCRRSGDCCTGMRCTNEKCEAGCRRPGDLCLDNSDCCSGDCTGGACVARSTCGARGDGCSDVEACCSGFSCGYKSICQPPTCTQTPRAPAPRQSCTVSDECCAGRSCISFTCG